MISCHHMKIGKHRHREQHEVTLELSLPHGIRNGQQLNNKSSFQGPWRLQECFFCCDKQENGQCHPKLLLPYSRHNRVWQKGCPLISKIAKPDWVEGLGELSKGLQDDKLKSAPQSNREGRPRWGVFEREETLVESLDRKFWAPQREDDLRRVWFAQQKNN